MGRWAGAKGQTNSAKKAKTYPNYDITHKKHLKRNFFKI